MKDYNYFQNDPWDSDSYGTGSTNPPKNHRSIVAVLLVAVIFLGGVSSLLGIMNIQMFRQLEQKQDSAMSFTGNESPVPSVSPMVSGPAVTVPSGEQISVDLRPAPGEVDNLTQEGGYSYQQIYEKAIDSVVSITCTLSSGSTSGTGVVLSEDGYIVTNCHVVEGARSVRVQLTDGQVLDAYSVGQDAISDLAVLYVDAKGLIPAEFGDSSQLRVGDAVAAIGDPLGADFRGTMTDGIISAINRDVTVEGRTMTLIQTNAALNSGNSGGPLLNCYGQVIGINTMKISAFVDSAGVEGIGFAIPSATVKTVVEQLMNQGYVSGRPALNIEGSSVSAFDQRFNRLPAGVLVSKVESGSCAQTAGLEVGDIILSMGGVRVESADALSSVLYNYNAGDKVQIQIYRYRTGKQYTLTLTLDEAVKKTS